MAEAAFSLDKRTLSGRHPSNEFAFANHDFSYSLSTVTETYNEK